MLEEIKNKCNKLIEETDDKKYKLIKDMLSNDNCFFDMPTDTALSILIDLGYSETDAIKKYILLTKRDNFVE